MKTSRNKRSKLILVLGGAASGKSQAALELAGQAAPRAFVATGEALDREMAVRIARHRATRSSDWVTAEVPRNITDWLNTNGTTYQSIVLDCFTLWLNNLQERRLSTLAISDATADMLHAIRATRARVVIVSNELGLGLVPMTKVVRAFRDLAGRVNQQVAAEADEVYLTISGIPLRLK
ncbi:MAG TPA: bifunctional adenosylcobinamide kinase/adenosylcobinamide-phosphate guanylyltransferase [Nitrospiraceae bacterium]|nr:bifunctional adenosylcobinamide kinase/adenosylcobinamide-phosphate guanylyltransferase [Nitrospiraceae bacterium]